MTATSGHTVSAATSAAALAGGALRPLAVREQYADQVVGVGSEDNCAAAVTVSGPRGGLRAYLEFDEEQAEMVARALSPRLAERAVKAEQFAQLLRGLARAIHRYEATDDADLIGEDTCREAAALREAASGLVTLVDTELLAAWEAEDMTQWRRDYPHYAIREDSA